MAAVTVCYGHNAQKALIHYRVRDISGGRMVNLKSQLINNISQIRPDHPTFTSGINSTFGLTISTYGNQVF